MTLCNVAIGYQRIGPSCFHLQHFSMKMGTAWSSYHKTSRRHNPENLDFNGYTSFFTVCMHIIVCAFLKKFQNILEILLKIIVLFISIDSKNKC